jgi:hypothetical protein
MGQLPPKLVDLLREMRSKGVSLAGLREATGLNQKTLIRYTSDVPRGGVCPCGRPADHGGGCSERRKRYSAEALARNIGDVTRKWNDEADAYLREHYPTGMSLEELAEHSNKVLGRTDITPSAVQVRIGKWKLRRNPDAVNNKAKAEARTRYWEKWRAGEITDNQRCPAPNADHPR